MRTVHLRFARGSASAAQIQQALDAWAREVGPDERAAGDLTFQVREDAAGLDPLSAAITVAIGIGTNLATDAVKALWGAHIGPYIERKVGLDALGEPENQAPASISQVPPSEAVDTSEAREPGSDSDLTVTTEDETTNTAAADTLAKHDK